MEGSGSFTCEVRDRSSLRGRGEDARRSTVEKPSLAEVAEDCFGLVAGDDRGEGGGIGLLHSLNATEVFEQAAGRADANPRNLEQFGGAVAHLPALAVEGDGEAVSLVADLLHEVQHRRVMVENNRLVFLSVDVDDFFPLGDSGQRLGDDFQ
jgi:hypothetical protein